MDLSGLLRFCIFVSSPCKIALPALCARLLQTEEPEEVQPVADDLRAAIHEHIGKVRETACEILRLDSVVNSAPRRCREVHKRRPRPEYQESN